VSLRNKFAEVASQLSKRPRNTGNEEQLAEDESKAHSCAKVVDDILPIVVSASDFPAFPSFRTIPIQPKCPHIVSLTVIFLIL
jgi:hypothetical protein